MKSFTITSALKPHPRRATLILIPGLMLAFLFQGCGKNIGEQVRGAIPFLPKSKYVNVGGRKLTRKEVDYYQNIKDYSTALKARPNDPVAFNSLGQLFQAKGNYDLAKQLYAKAASLDPTQSEAHHNLGVIATYESRFAKAIEHLRAAVRLSPDDAKIWRHLGNAYQGIGKSRNAWQSYEKSVELDDEFTAVYLDQAKFLYSQQRYREAEAKCREALAHLPPPPPPATAMKSQEDSIVGKVLPDFGSGEEVVEFTPEFEARFDLALCLKAQGRLREAMETLIPCEACVTGKADIQILKSRLQEGLGDKNGAIATLEALRLDFPDMAEIVKRLARLNLATGRTKRAFQQQLQAAELDYSDRDLQIKAAHAAEKSGNQAQAIAIFERLVRGNPDDVATWRRLATAYDQAGIKHQAAFAYQEIINREQHDLKVRRRLGMLYADLPGYQGRATYQFMRILKTNPRDLEVHRRMGDLYLASRRLDLAEKHINQAIKLDPQHAETNLKLARLYMLQNRGADAVSSYRKALSLDNSLNDAHLELAQALIRIDRREDAIPHLVTYLKSNPKNKKARRLYADQLRDLNRREEAVTEYKKIANDDPSDIGTIMKLARLTTLLGKKEQAAGMYETLLERNPSNVEALRSAARLYQELKQPLRKMYCWQRLHKLRPSDIDARENLAASYKEIGSDTEAITMYEELGHADAWKNVAFLRLRREDALRSNGEHKRSKEEHQKALKAYRRVIELEKNDVPVRMALASILKHSEDRDIRDEASALYQAVIKIDPTHQKARLNLGNLFSQDNRLAQAQDEYDIILRQDASNVGAHLGLGVVFRKLGKYKKALKEYQAALKANPNNTSVHFNTAVLYDYYLEDPAKAQQHYHSFKKLGGDASRIPKPASPEENAPHAVKKKRQKKSAARVQPKAGVVTLKEIKPIKMPNE